MLAHDPILDAEAQEVVRGIILIVFLIVAWVMGYFATIHARISGRSVLLWTIVAFIPVAGPILYFSYSYYKALRSMATHKQSQRELMGEYLLKPKTIGKVLEHEAKAALRNFRDPEVEKLIREGKIEDARKKIAARQTEAAFKHNAKALETYHLYIELVERYSEDVDIDPELAELLGYPIEPETETIDSHWDKSDYDKITGHADKGGYLVETDVNMEEEPNIQFAPDEVPEDAPAFYVDPAPNHTREEPPPADSSTNDEDSDDSHDKFERLLEL